MATLTGLRDLARAVLPVGDRVMASFDAAVARTERLASTTFRYGVDQAVKLARRAPTTTLSQIQPINEPYWDLVTVKDALEQHELGFFLQSTALTQAMGRDDRIKGCLNTRVHALAGKSGVGFSLTPSTRGDRQAAQDLAKEITEVWWYSCSEATMMRILSDAVMLGVAFARIHWERFDGRVVPRLEPWIAQTVYYDWSIRRYRAIGIEGQVVIDPGSAEWLIFEPWNFMSWMEGAVRRLSLPFLYRLWSTGDWARYCEKHGLPIFAFMEPSGSQFQSAKDRFYASLAKMGREGRLRLPKDAQGNGFDVKLIEPRDKSYGAFREFLDYLNTSIAITLLGQNLMTEVKGGSFAAAKMHNLIRLDLLDSDAEILSTALREYVWKPYVRFNHGTDDEDATPWPTWATRPPDDKKAKADIIFSFSQACANFATAAVPVDVPMIAADLEIPMTKDMRPILMPPGGAPPRQPAEDVDPNPMQTPAAPTAQPGATPNPTSVPADKSGAASPTAEDGAQSTEAAPEAARIALAAPPPPLTKVRAYGDIRVTIDRPEGFVQRGIAQDGTPWERVYKTDYGYLDGTLGGDGEELDVFCGPDEDAADVYLIAQNHPDGSFDEWKLMLGFASQEDAVACYADHIPARLIGRIIALPVAAILGLLGYDPATRAEHLNLLWRTSVDADVEAVLLRVVDNMMLSVVTLGDPDQPRDDNGQWSTGGGSGGADKDGKTPMSTKTMEHERIVQVADRLRALVRSAHGNEVPEHELKHWLAESLVHRGVNYGKAEKAAKASSQTKADAVAKGIKQADAEKELREYERITTAAQQKWREARAKKATSLSATDGRYVHPNAVAAAHAAMRSVVTTSPVRFRTWAVKQTDASLKRTAANTLRLMKTDVAVWDVYDVRRANAIARKVPRLLKQPMSPMRDSMLWALGHEIHGEDVAWHDAE
jgi:phage gp29-like protein